MFTGKDIDRKTLSREVVPLAPRSSSPGAGQSTVAEPAPVQFGLRARLTRNRWVRAAGRFALGLATIGRVRQTAYVTRDQVAALAAQVQGQAEAIDALTRTSSQQGHQIADIAERGHRNTAALDHHARTLDDHDTRARRHAETVAAALSQHAWRIDSFAQGLAETEGRNQTRTRAFEGRLAAIAQRLSALATPDATSGSQAPDPQGSAAMDSFYHAFEARFRGERADIKARQRVYLGDLEQARQLAGDGLVVDIGCGRGEWLELLREEGYQAMGVDTNDAQLEDARAEGLAVVLGDGLALLRAQPDASLLAVTSFHVIEHIPFDMLATWMVEIHRALKPGGVMILETPNPENLLVGATTFHMDPTHVKPVPRGLSTILAETSGFDPVDTRLLHPHAKLEQALKEVPTDLAYLLFGYQDYALIGRKPAI